MSKKKKNHPEKKPKEPFLKNETKRGITIIILLALAFIFILGLANLAGDLSLYLDKFLKTLFGWGKFFFPLILIGLGYLLFFPQKHTFKKINLFGFLIFVFSYSAFLHLFVPFADSFSSINQGRGGGYFGFILSHPLRKLMGTWATAIVLIAIFFISLLVIFNTSLEKLAEKRNFFSRFYIKLKEVLFSFRSKFVFKNKKLAEEKKFPPEAALKEKELPEEPTTPERKPEITHLKEQEAKEQLTLPPFKKLDKSLGFPINLLADLTSKPTSGDINLNKEKIRRTLENFGIPVEMGEINIGPTVTQYTLRPSEGIKLAQITTLSNDLALALAAHPIRIEAPIPGKSLVGIEVPNQTVAIVGLKDILKSEEFKNRKSNLTIALGKDVSGKAWVADLDTMPHLLIAGATGSGKTVCINSIIASLLYQNSPEILKLILVDPKRVELPVYDGIPHLITPVITDVEKTISALKWVVEEMNQRFNLLSGASKHNITAYNKENTKKLPYLVVIIDELADLMSVAAREVEAVILRLAQMARAVGIHLVVSTQRPSVDVITGLIKANITSRIAFNVASLMDSRTILDFSGAEKLLGKGDMLYISAHLSKPKRLQAAYLDPQDIKKIVSFMKDKAQPEYQDEVIEKFSPLPQEEWQETGDDELLEEAKEVIFQAGRASASLLQRRLRIGYARAARLLDILEKRGIIGPGDGAKPREILMKEEKGEDDDDI